MKILSEECWHVDSEGGFIRDMNEKPVAYIFDLAPMKGFEDLPSHEFAESCARLIAAAPRMLRDLLHYRSVKCGKQCKFLKQRIDNLLDYIDCVSYETCEGTEISE